MILKKQFYLSPLRKKNKLIWFFSLLLLSGSILIYSCKNEKKPKNADVSLTEVPEDFVTFFERFHTDSTFQMNHITFPLEGTRKVASTTGDSLIEYRWQKETWRIHRPFDNYDSLFTRKFYMVGDNIIIEKITGVNGLFTMERRFAKLNDGWNLIYYSVN